MDSKTNDAIDNERKETIQEILRYFECDNSILVKMIIEMAGSKDGDNYMSVVKRLIVSGTHDTNQNENGNFLFLHLFRNIFITCKSYSIVIFEMVSLRFIKLVICHTKIFNKKITS